MRLLIWSQQSLFSNIVQTRAYRLQGFLRHNLRTYKLFMKFWGLFGWFKTGSCYVVQAGLELMVLLPQLPECWDL
jgi:hypothetical protein